MGLDIYFYKRTKWNSGFKPATGRDFTDEVDNTPTMREVAYFRKANMLISHFNYCDNGNTLPCKYIKISKEQVKDLLDKCDDILKTYNTQPNKIDDNDYIEYIEDIKNTFETIYDDIDFTEYNLLMYCSW